MKYKQIKTTIQSQTSKPSSSKYEIAVLGSVAPTHSKTWETKPKTHTPWLAAWCMGLMFFPPVLEDEFVKGEVLGGSCQCWTQCEGGFFYPAVIS